MKQSIQLGIGIVVFILLLAFINLQPDKKRVNWTPTFSQTDKNPFGAYVLHQELGEWITEDKPQILTASSFYSELNADTTSIIEDTVPTTFFLIRPSFNIYSFETERLKEIVSEGHTAFISASSFPYKFLTTLDSNLYLEYNYNDDFIHVKTVNNDSLIYPKGKFEYSFYDENNQFETYSYTKNNSGGGFNPDLIKIPVGKGSIIIHSFPYALSNYYLLHEDTTYRAYAKDVLNMLPKQKTYWVTIPTSDSPRNNDSKGLLTIIRQIPQLFSAWKLLLIGVLIYVLFKAKREQRPIPIIPELKNESKAYIRVISDLYFHEKNYLNLVHKKMLFLFDQLKTHHHIDADHLTDPKIIVNKTQSSETDVNRLLILINQCHQQKEFTKEEFLEFCSLTDKILKS